MPAVTILSPYSGRPVVVREQDLGRAIRDEEGRIFYVVEDPEHGRYAARTRKGSAKDLERYRALQSKLGKLDDSPAVQAARSAQVYDATGTKRRNPLGTLVLLLIVAALAGGAYVYITHPQWLGLGGDEPQAPEQPTPGDAAEPTGMRAPRIVFASDRPDARPYDDFSHAASGLRYKLTHSTDGPPAQAGSFVHVRYAAQTIKGKPLIDDAQQSFVLLSGQAIRAFDEGLAGVREGEQLSLLVPRGHSEHGHLPGIDRVPDEPFLLDVQLVSVRPGVSHIVERPGRADDVSAMAGDRVAIHYVIRVEGREQVIDTTSLRGEPMRLTLGSGQVIPGLELGILGMRVGETRLLSIPHYLAYGEDEVAGGLIPARAVLSVRVMLVEIQSPEADAD